MFTSVKQLFRDDRYISKSRLETVPNPENDLASRSHESIEKDRAAVYNNWFHDYSPETLRPVTGKAVFTMLNMWSDLAGAD